MFPAVSNASISVRIQSYTRRKKFWASKTSCFQVLWFFALYNEVCGSLSTQNKDKQLWNLSILKIMITETFETHCFWWHSQVKTLRNKVFWVTTRVFETKNSLFVHFDISQSGMAGSSVFLNSEKPMFPGSIGRLKVTESEEHLPLPTSFFPTLNSK